MNARTGFALSIFAILAVPAAAQEKYWVGGGVGVAQIDASGFLWQTAPPGAARDIGVAPDGKVWIPAATITVLNPDGSLFTSITPSPSMAPYAIAFDRLGHAWVTSSGTGGMVEEFSATGTSLGVVPLTVGQARGICVDVDGNKWIAHRLGPPGSLSRIDGITGAVSNHPLPATSRILPITVVADARGLFNSSRIWTVGDNRGAGEVVELDSTGTPLNTYVISSSARLQWMSTDCDANGITRNVWVGDWGNGELHRVDAATGGVTTFPQGVGVGGVTFDGFGDLWITLRTGGVVRRIDEAAGGIEVAAAVGASSQISTRWHFATVVDQLGDLDADGNPNLIEVMGGSSPFDTCSVGLASLSVSGSMAIGTTMTVDVQAAPSAVSLVAFATATISPAIVLPGIACSVTIDPATFLGTFLVPGAGSLPLAIPNSTAFVGFRLLAQALNATVPTFTNVAPMLTF